MEKQPKVDTDLNMLNASVDSALQSVDKAPFSQPAFTTIKTKILEYISELIEESHKASRRDSSDVISAKHVEFAVNRLKLLDKGSESKHLGTVGGVFLGTCLSNLYPMITTNQFSLNGVLFTLLSGMFGVILLTVNVFKE